MGKCWTFALFWHPTNCLPCHIGGVGVRVCAKLASAMLSIFAPMRGHFRVHTNVAGTCAAQSQAIIPQSLTSRPRPCQPLARTWQGRELTGRKKSTTFVNVSLSSPPCFPLFFPPALTALRLMGYDLLATIFGPSGTRHDA
jgi:hypothetical protein